LKIWDVTKNPKPTKEASRRDPGARGIDGMDNFRCEFASVSVFEDMICIFKNPPDMDADVDSGQADIWRIR
jgi:hypothetical protein